MDAQAIQLWLALLICMGLAGASPAKRQLLYNSAGTLDAGQLAVKCGQGTLVEWYATEGDFVEPGTPVCEVCQPTLIGQLARSVTCYSPANGYVIATESLSPGDDLHANSASGVVAVIQRQLDSLKGVAVHCSPGAHFERLTMRPGAHVHLGDPVALAQGASGEAVTCRAPTGGRLVAAHPGHGHSPDGRAVAWIKPEAPAETALETSKSQYQLANPAPCLAVLVASGVRSTLTSKEVAVLQTSVAVGLDVGASDVVISSISDLLEGVSVTLETTKPSQATIHKPEEVARRLEKVINESLTEMGSHMTVSVRSIRLSAHTPAFVQPQHHLCGSHQPAAQRRHSGGGTSDSAHTLRSSGHSDLEARGDAALHGGSKREMDDSGHREAPSIIQQGLEVLYEGKAVWGSILAIFLAFSLCLCFRASDSKRSLYRCVATDDVCGKPDQPDRSDRQQENKAIIEFEDRGSSLRRVCFWHSGHGMVLYEGTPIAVKSFRFNSYAMNLGVQKGWRITKVAGQPVLSTDGPSDVYELLLTRLRHLPSWPLRIVFDSKDNGVKTFSFNRQPLGIEVSEEAPMTVKHFKPDSHAEVRGVEVGWEILHIGNMPMRPDTSASEVAEWLESGTAHLPQEAGGVPAIFLDQEGNRRTMSLRRKPLGVIFSRSVPVRVEGYEFNSYARDIGIQLGWQLVRLGSQEVSLQAAPEEVEQRLGEKLAPAAPWPLRMDFLTKKGDVKVFYFDRQPLGVEFTRSAPFKISCFKPDGPARGNGLEVGWTALRVGNGLLSSETAHDVFMRYLDSGLCHLPTDPPGGLLMDFLDSSGKARTMHFHRQPFGMAFTEQNPSMVEGFHFNSYAKDIGVRSGWQLLRAGGQDVTAYRSREEVQATLQELQVGLRPWPVRMEFSSHDGAVRTLFFDRQPLGLEFVGGSTLQVSVLKPDSHAAACGVCMGWTLLRAGDAATSGQGERTGCRELDPDKLLRLLDREVARLPQEPRGLKVEFAGKDGRCRAIHFRRAPLGLRLRAAPAAEGGGAGLAAEVVGFDFNSYAKDMGVQVGLRVLRVGQVAAAPWRDLAAVEDALRAGAEGLPPWPLRMDFEPDDGSAVKVCFFEHQLLGLELSNDAPPRVRSLDTTGCAFACGLKPGWRIMRVGDVVVGHDMNREQLLAYIKAGSAHLPW